MIFFQIWNPRLFETVILRKNMKENHFSQLIQIFNNRVRNCLDLEKCFRILSGLSDFSWKIWKKTFSLEKNQKSFPKQETIFFCWNLSKAKPLIWRFDHKYREKILGEFVLIFEPVNSRFCRWPVLILHRLKFQTLILKWKKIISINFTRREKGGYGMNLNQKFILQKRGKILSIFNLGFFARNLFFETVEDFKNELNKYFFSKESFELNHSSFKIKKFISSEKDLTFEKKLVYLFGLHLWIRTQVFQRKRVGQTSIDQIITRYSKLETLEHF